MKLNLYFNQDKIIAYGGIIIPVGDDLPIEVCSGVDIVREYDNNHYYISLNKCIEQRVLKIYNEAKQGARSKIYELIGSREPTVYDLLIGRLLKNEPVNDPVKNYYFLWKEVHSRGIYSQTCAAYNYIMDKAVHDGIFEYDNSGYYSVAYQFIKQIKQKRGYKVEDAMEIIQCPDKELTISVFENFGYKWKNGKIVSIRDIVFDQYF